MQSSSPSHRPRGPRNITDCDSLGALLDRSRILQDLDRQLRQRLPPTLAEQVRLGNVRGERIVFVASSAAWASRLRMEQTTILRLARTLGVPARLLTIKVVPLTAPPQEPTAAAALSAVAAQHLRAAAGALSDPELREQFLALASLAGS